jgi:tRNA (mo5U34)-methyltransferase
MPDHTSSGEGVGLDAEPLRRNIEELGPWFHNLTLDGVETAPTHYLGNYPSEFYRSFSHALPDDLRGWTVLDVGCNAGFYAFEMKRRGAAQVVGLETDARYLRQARFAAERLRLDVELQHRSVFDVAHLKRRFDLVLFMGVLYHLRHPLLALDLLRQFAVGRLMVFQTMLRGSMEVTPLGENYEFSERSVFDDPGYPRLHFVERQYAHDETNWWIPNRACAEAMLRSAGFEIVDHPVDEIYLCRPTGSAAKLPESMNGRVHA